MSQTIRIHRWLYGDLLNWTSINVRINKWHSDYTESLWSSPVSINDRNVYLKFEITDGYFENDFLYYGGYSSTPYQVNLEKTKDNYEKTSIIPDRTSYNPDDLLDEYAYFKIPIPDEQYLFISIPKYKSLRTSVKVSFESTLSVGEIVGIAIGCSIGFIIIVVALSIYCKRRQMRTEEGLISKP